MKLVTLFAAYALPVVAFAQETGDNALFDLIQRLINAVIPILFALAILFFLWKLASYLFGSGEVKEEARSGMIMGIIVLLVMFSIAGVINLLQNTLNFDDSANVNVPEIEFTGNNDIRIQ